MVTDYNWQTMKRWTGTGEYRNSNKPVSVITIQKRIGFLTLRPESQPEIKQVIIPWNSILYFTIEARDSNKITNTQYDLWAIVPDSTLRVSTGTRDYVSQKLDEVLAAMRTGKDYDATRW